MRRFTQQRPTPYKAPRLFTMLSLLVCLLIVMINLRSFREPRPGVQRIISNLDQSLKQVNDQAPQENTASSTGPASAEAQTPAEPSATAPPDSTAQSDTAAPQSDPPPQASDAPTESEASNQPDSLNFNLREDLELQDWMGLIQDGTLSMQKLEMPAYWRIVGLVKRASFEDLLGRADAKFRFNDLYSAPSKNRSRLLTLNVNIRKITRYETDPNEAGVSELFEVWGWSETSKSWLYVFVTPELPPGLDANTPVNQSAKFAGYFFKIQGYHPGAAKPDSQPERAPLMIGKFELIQKKPAGAGGALFSPLDMVIGVIILVAGLTAILLRIFVFRSKPPRVVRTS